MRKQADMSEFIGAQFFFDSMTRRTMKEYAMSGEVDSHILILTDTKENNGAKKVVGSGIVNAFNMDGLEFLVAMLANTTQKLEFIKNVRELQNEIIAIYEAYLIKSNGERMHDALLTIQTYKGITVKRTFVAMKNNMSLEENGVNYEMEFTEIDDD